MTGAELRVAREALGLSRRALSEELATVEITVAAHTLYEWETGRRWGRGSAGIPSGVAEWVRGELARRAISGVG